VFEIANLSPYCIADKIFHVTVLLLIYFGDQFVASEIRHRRHVTAVFVNNQHDNDIKRRGQDFDTKFVFERVPSEEIDRRIFLRNLTKRGVNKLFKKLRDTGTVNRRPGKADLTVPALRKIS